MPVLADHSPLDFPPLARRSLRAILLALALALPLAIAVVGCRPSADSAGSGESTDATGPKQTVGTPDATPRGSMSLVHPAGRLSPDQARELAALEAQERQAEATIWAPEMLAQRCGRTFEDFWNSLNRTPLTNRLRRAAFLPTSSLVLPSFSAIETLPHGIERYAPTGTHSTSLSESAWRRQIETWAEAGWHLLQVEFRHVRFTPNSTGGPDHSDFVFAAHLIHATEPDRAAIAGTLRVDWGDLPPGSEDPIPVKRIDASGVTLDRRRGKPPFQLLLEEPIERARDTSLVDPLIVHDLDGNERSEILLVGRNLVFRLQPDGRYRSEPLCLKPSGPVFAALAGDFDGDGAVDLLAVRAEGLVLFRGNARGTFEEPAVTVWPAPPDLRYAMALTAGDIDGDGDLDVFLVQYKVSYEIGSMPTPFHDANDGYPAHLLRNDAGGRFTDITKGSGLEPKARRRSYGASLVDLDRDGRLDLVVISDFAGVDMYRGDGRGRFEDRTETWTAERRAFGMADALSDFDRDGRLDLLVMGMPSATASRLDGLGLGRMPSGEDRLLRGRMTYGNRLYLAQENGGFAETKLSESIAQSGWSWGCAALDADNDGYPDVYVANGLESRESVRDYEGEYWLHDLYVNGSEEDPVAYLYYMSKFNRTRGRGQSYGGYDKNRFFLNHGGTSFLEVGHLFGLASEADSRNAAADDLDGDGRPDLVMTSYEVWPQSRQVLRIYRNALAGTGSWIGFRFPPAAHARQPAGVTVEIRTSEPEHRAVRAVVMGDSYRTQHSSSVHFGLGEATAIAEARIRWPGGTELVLTNPAVRTYHEVLPAGAKPAGSNGR